MIYCAFVLLQLCIIEVILIPLVRGYQTLTNCRTEVCKALGMAEEQCELSMGMSGDFELAVSINASFESVSTIRARTSFSY